MKWKFKKKELGQKENENENKKGSREAGGKYWKNQSFGYVYIYTYFSYINIYIIVEFHLYHFNVVSLAEVQLGYEWAEEPQCL